MYQILDRSDERVTGHGSSPERNAAPLKSGEDEAFVLHMQQNRSSFPQEARGTFAVLVPLLMATSILPAFKGHTLVPLISLGVMALLVWALEHHAKKGTPSERLEIADGEIRYADSQGRLYAQPSYWIRFETQHRAPADVRLLLRSRDHVFEVGTSLSLDERLAIAPVIDRALVASRGARAC